MFQQALHNFRSKRFKVLVYITLIIVTLLGSVYLFGVWQISLDSIDWRNTLSSFIISLIASFAAVALGVNRLQKFIDSSNRRRNLGEMRTFWDVKDSTQGFVIVYGGEIGNFFDDRPTKTSEATIRSIARIMSAIRRVHGDNVRVDVENYRDFKKENFGSSNVVVLGGYLSVPPVKQIARVGNFPFLQNFDDDSVRFIFKSDQKAASVERRSERVGEDLRSDWAFVAKVEQADSLQTVFFFSGNYGAGTYASVLTATTVRHPNLDCKRENANSKQWIIEARQVSEEALRRGELSSIYIDASEEFDANIPQIINLLHESDSTDVKLQKQPETSASSTKEDDEYTHEK